MPNPLLRHHVLQSAMQSLAAMRDVDLDDEREPFIDLLDSLGEFDRAVQDDLIAAFDQRAAD